MSPAEYAIHIDAVTSAVVKVIVEIIGGAGAVCTAWTSFMNKRDIAALDARQNRHGQAITTLLKDSPAPGQATIITTSLEGK